MSSQASPGGETGSADPHSRHTPTVVSSEAPSPLVTEHGRTRIADTVVEKVAAVAAREVPGVHRLGSGAARALGSLRERIPGQRVALGQGVAVEVGERQTAVDLDVVVDYGYPIATVATQVRQNVIAAVQQLVGLEVTEVNISVNDVHLPDDTDDDDDEPEARVQ